MMTSTPYAGFEGEFFSMPSRNVIPKPLQKPHPPIVVTAVAPFSKGVTEAAARGWDPISANFLMPAWVKSHWPRDVEGCERIGRTADPANWRVAKSVFVANDASTAKAYATDPNGPYVYYYRSLFTKLKKSGRIELFKTRRDQPDDEVTLETICDRLIIHGTPDSVADQLLAFQDEVGAFGTLLYAGKDWKDPELGRQSMILMADKVMPRVNAGTLGLTTGRKPTLHASATSTAAMEMGRSSIRALASETWVNSSKQPVDPCTSRSKSGRSTLGSMRATMARSATREAGSGTASSRSRLIRAPALVSSRAALSGNRAATSL